MIAYINENDLVIAIGIIDDLFPNCEPIEITEEEKLFIEGCKLPKRINGVFVDAYVEVIEVPQQLSRMKFIIQVFITTDIRYEDIVLFIQNLTFDEAQKYVILTRLRSATHFDRNSSDLLTIASMMGITSEQLDSIFINGNLIE